jgi:hypothetical protein
MEANNSDSDVVETLSYFLEDEIESVTGQNN